MGFVGGKKIKFVIKNHKFMDFIKVCQRLQRYSISVMKKFLQCDAPVKGDKGLNETK